MSHTVFDIVCTWIVNADFQAWPRFEEETRMRLYHLARDTSRLVLGQKSERTFIWRFYLQKVNIMFVNAMVHGMLQEHRFFVNRGLRDTNCSLKPQHVIGETLADIKNSDGTVKYKKATRMLHGYHQYVTSPPPSEKEDGDSDSAESLHDSDLDPDLYIGGM